MKRRLTSLVAGLMVLGFSAVATADVAMASSAASSAPAPVAKTGILSDSGVSVALSYDMYSAYVWRGFLLDDDAVVQPGASVSFGGFTFGIWGSTDIEANDGSSSEEVDYYFDYTKEFDGFSLSIGNTYYDFPDASAHAEEAYVGVAFDCVLAPSLTVYVDYGQESDGSGKGMYISLDAGHSFDVSEFVALDLGFHYGYNDELFIAGTGSDVLVTAGLSITLAENFSFAPVMAYSMPFGDLEDENDGNQDEKFYAGASLSYSF